MRRRKSRFAIVAIATASVVATAAVADTLPEDAKDYRTAVMTSLRGHVVAASMHVRGLVDDQSFLIKHAEGLVNGAAELNHLFPAGSAVDDSEALPAIWDDPDGFSKAIAKAERATEEFRDAVASGDQEAYDEAFREVGMSCRGCHDQYRRDDDD